MCLADIGRGMYGVVGIKIIVSLLIFEFRISDIAYWLYVLQFWKASVYMVKTELKLRLRAALVHVLLTYF
jgi:hypothetical protein